MLLDSSCPDADRHEYTTFQHVDDYDHNGIYANAPTAAGISARIGAVDSGFSFAHTLGRFCYRLWPDRSMAAAPLAIRGSAAGIRIVGFSGGMRRLRESN